MDRRNFFQGSALMSTGALLGCATPGIAQQKVKTPFDDHRLPIERKAEA